METKRLTQNLSVTAQLQPADVTQAARDGFKAIICNRPDDEEPGQPDFDEIAAVAQALGMQARHIPVDAERTVAMQKDEFARALAELPGPVLAYCRTGNRCIMLHEAAGG